MAGCATIRHMQFFKRFELWVLLALIVAGLAWVFMSGGKDDNSDDTTGASITESDAPLRLHRCMLKRDYGNARLDIDLRVRNDSAEKLVMQTPKVKLLTGKGREVPSFFLPFDPIPEIAPKSSQDVQLRYWLDAADLDGALKLEVDGKSLPIKSDKAFDLKTMANSEEKVMLTGGW
jgi:hypothetical protein